MPIRMNDLRALQIAINALDKERRQFYQFHKMFHQGFKHQKSGNDRYELVVAAQNQLISLRESLSKKGKTND